MDIKKTIIVTALVMLVMTMFSVDSYAQTVSAKVGTGDKEKKEEPKEKVVEKVVEKSGPSVEQELKKLFGLKSETSLTGPRVENIGKYFLDKYTGEVTIVGYYKNEPVRWRILRDNVPEDVINEDQLVNYQLIRFGTGDNDIVLVNVNSGVMWAVDFKGLSFTYKNTRFAYIPMKDTEW